MSITIDILKSEVKEWNGRANKWGKLAKTHRGNIDKLNEVYWEIISSNEIKDVGLRTKEEIAKLAIDFLENEKNECENKAREGRELVEKIEKGDRVLSEELNELGELLKICGDSKSTKYTLNTCERLKILINKFALTENENINYKHHMKGCSALPGWPYRD
ncbi:hypothetical protein [Nostoc sp. UIC 10630]|uniref:hypothetical protein n=1 Tax=Nostoc sp. UIC 10630 TaxID=2100146 RepID=UPI0013D87FF9|nr:hypothetical protein [Nostoc sp. UIC 10630]NEU82245.1 hypothetical protein [Nostoc sp. UIC 10630]